MLFHNDEVSLKLEVLRYEFPADGGQFGSDDRNWLVLRGTYTEDGQVIKDTVSCLLTYELRELTAGLKVLKAGLKDVYESDFAEPFFMFSAKPADGAYDVYVEFALPNTMEDVDVAEVSCLMTAAELDALIAELDVLCEKFPDRN